MWAKLKFIGTYVENRCFMVSAVNLPKKKLYIAKFLKMCIEVDTSYLPGNIAVFLDQVNIHTSLELCVVAD
jgi:hypothetical protein